MQTFLPFPDFQASAQCLDNKRLGKQRVEALQILNVLSGKRSGWANHPAVKMWRGYEYALREYMDVMIAEWVRRGFKNTMNAGFVSYGTERPPWFGDEAFHRSHRSNLLRKDFVHYSKFFVEPVDLPYIWPESNTL